MLTPKSSLPYLATIISGLILATACSTQTPGADIVGQTWQWAALIETEPASQSVVPDPANYTLQLQADGNITIQADCNMVSGTYTLNGAMLTIELGPSTLAFCGEQSLDLQYLELLDKVESYSIENDQLVLNLENDAGKMMFAK